MLSFLSKKKLTDYELARAFVRRLLDAVDAGWPEVAAFINESAEFKKTPKVHPQHAGPFAMIVLTANLNNMETAFSPAHGNQIRKNILDMLSDDFGMEQEDFYKRAHEFRVALARVNHPSKNTITAMSKTIFWRYQLNQFQRDDYREVGLPNPLFIQRMDEVMEHFLWDWEDILKHYKITSAA